MHAVEAILALLFAVAALTTFARRLVVPGQFVLVLCGFAAGLLPGLPRVELEPNVVLPVALPPPSTGPTWWRCRPTAVATWAGS
jgi:CPA1 family monovalent cation:H+ antiporter